MRRILAFTLFAIAVLGPIAALAAEPAGPVVDVIEIAGVIDRPLERYATERLSEAEREKDALVVFVIDSLGGAKISDDDVLPPLVRRIRDSSVPVAVFIGPRAARASGLPLFMAAAAHVSAIGPSARVGALVPTDVARGFSSFDAASQTSALQALASARGHDLQVGHDGSIGANEAQQRGLADMVVPSVAEFLRRIDGRTVTTSAGTVAVSLPADETTVRFFQPGPLRRLLHAFANPALAYLCLLAGALLIVFELFQPGFGVAGVTGGLLVLAGGYGLTVLPANVIGVVLFAAGLVLLAFDVARDEMLIPTGLGTAALIAGSVLMLPRWTEAVRLSPWLIASSIVGALIFYVPVMTMVQRARSPISGATRGALIGETGDVRSTLNPEGYVWVADELWRARSEDGVRRRVGEAIVVSKIDGAVLIVRSAVPANGAADLH